VTSPSQAIAEPTHAAHAESLSWIRALSGTGHERDQAIERLHGLLLRVSRHEVRRRGGPGDLDDLAVQAADDALLAILSKLHTYRGDSRFTTWAYKFAVFEAAVKLRRRPWQAREVPPASDGLAQLASDFRASPARRAEASEPLGAVRDAIVEALTPQQRSVLVAITLNDVPIDVLAERRGTTRGALYKTLHDARHKLRRELAKSGLSAE
jgi:RNA polymerase sigma-70 factor (ECF subfamily)